MNVRRITAKAFMVSVGQDAHPDRSGASSIDLLRWAYFEDRDAERHRIVGLLLGSSSEEQPVTTN